LLESHANISLIDNEKMDVLRTVNYIYDIELSESNEILGGEWYQNTHPDFIWTPAEGARALSVADADLNEAWESGLPPKSWRESARKASYLGQPLAGVIDYLLELSVD
jgi:hypothetical protein